MTKQGGMDGADYIGTYKPRRGSHADDVGAVKSASVSLINAINHFGNDKRRNAIACTHVEEASMMAVKSIFSGDKE